MDSDNIKSVCLCNDEFTEYIKRGIFSALQLDVAPTKDTDFNGVWDANRQVVKTKDLLESEKCGLNEIGKMICFPGKV